MSQPSIPQTQQTAQHVKTAMQPLPVPGPIHDLAHRARRDRLAMAVAQLSHHEPAVVVAWAGQEILRNRDNPYPFRSDSNFFYLTGFPEPDAWLVMSVEADGSHTDQLFCRDRDPAKEIWDGIRVGPEQAAEQFYMDQACSLSQLTDLLPGLLKNRRLMVAPLGRSSNAEQSLANALNQARGQARAGQFAPGQWVDLDQLVGPLRQIKDQHELATMQEAANIAALGHVKAMRASAAGKAEYEIEAVLLEQFRRSGAQSVAYGSIVASGPHSCILHHRAGDRVMQNGDMLLIDAGCELHNYASDITRSFPVNGRFSPEQKAVYEVVLAAQEAAIAATVPGAAFTAPHQAAVRVLTQGMLDLDLLPKQSVEAAIESGAYQRFYMHRTGHWLGMDVHDIGDYQQPLTPGQVLTIEPGFYIRPDDHIPPAFWNIGIRIEDDAVVTQSGCHLLTRGVPVAVAAIEDLMRSD